MTVNVITSGGGQYIVNVLNAVAAWTGGGGFRSMLQVVMVMGLGYSLLIMAFSLNLDPAYVGAHQMARYIGLALLMPAVTAYVLRRMEAYGGFGSMEGK